MDYKKLYKDKLYEINNGFHIDANFAGGICHVKCRSTGNVGGNEECFKKYQENLTKDGIKFTLDEKDMSIYYPLENYYDFECYGISHTFHNLEEEDY